LSRVAIWSLMPRPMSIENLVKAHIETELVPDRKLDLAPDTSLTGIVDSSGILEIVVWI